MADETGSMVDTATMLELSSSKTDDAATLPADGSWSKILGSPTELTSFSPSLDFNGGNLHGHGMCVFRFSQLDEGITQWKLYLIV